MTTLLGIEFCLALFKVSMTYATFSSMLLLLAIFSSSLLDINCVSQFVIGLKFFLVPGADL